MTASDFSKWLLVFAVVIMPFTQLRFGPLGFGEIIFLGFFLILLVKKRVKIPTKNSFVISKFWLVYIILSVSGFFYNYFILNHASGTIQGMLFDLMAFTIVLICVYTFEAKYLLGHFDLINFVKTYYIMASLLFIILHIMSFFTSSIAGFQLRYHIYFSPLVDNVHQTAMLFCSLPFLGLYLLTLKQSFIVKVFILVSIVWIAIMALKTGTTKSTLGIIAGVTIFITHVVFFSFGKTFKVYFGVMALAILLFSITITSLPEISAYAVDFFVESDGGGAREGIYKNGVEHSKQSIILGYGPGAHIIFMWNDFSDAHNTFLTVLLQSGILGILLFLRLIFYKMLPTYFIHPAIIACFGSILIYVTGGDVLRRIPIWLLLLFIYLLAKELNNRKMMLSSRS